ncbi:MAG: Baseplate J-like protein [Syntrophaceae bacterium PtaU1.Bin231]|nr:MAG: Baseplate J-like protein [Syntrophaceae bacterium PtaU1.Bin231]
MSFLPRTYEEIVRDLLTTLTSGTVREQVKVLETGGQRVTEKLSSRPVRRVSFVEEIRTDEQGKKTKIRYTAADYELFASDGSENNLDTIRFRKGKQQPDTASTLSVNYYPVSAEPTPLTDLNVGSVVRTLMETFARELALSDLSLDYIYKSGYLETATGPSLDKVVALVGVKRLPAGYPTVKVRFSRNPASPGRISIPAGTAIVDAKNNRYLTLEALVLEPYESSREVLAAGEKPGTGEVAAGELNRLEIVIAGIAEATNVKESSKSSAAESDDDLRRRAAGALHGVMRGTVNALQYGLLSIPGVKSVNVVEFPNDIAGEVRVEVSYSDDTPEVRAQVADRIRELRPAGIRVISGEAAKKPLEVQLDLTLTGKGVSQAELEPLKTSAETAIAKYLTDLPPGGSARQARMSALLLADARIADAKVRLIVPGKEAQENLSLESNEVFEVKRPFTFAQVVAEEQAAAQAVSSKATFYLPLHLVAGVTGAQAQSALDTALTAYLAGRSPSAPVSVDTLAASIRDDSRYALVRDEATITIEKGDAFMQLADGQGQYVPAVEETMEKQAVNLDIREGGV